MGLRSRVKSFLRRGIPAVWAISTSLATFYPNLEPVEAAEVSIADPIADQHQHDFKNSQKGRWKLRIRRKESDEETIQTAVRKSVEEFSNRFEGKSDVLIVLLASAFVAPTMKRLKLSPILGFLTAGLLIGPNGFSLIKDLHTTEALAELGIVFFLFEMGLELSLDRLVSMKKDVFGLGMLQFLATTAGISVVSQRLGVSSSTGLVLGGGLALSSSAFVLQLLRDRDDLGTRYGRASFGMLLFQDLAIVPLLVAVPLLATGGAGIQMALLSAGVKAILALAIISFVGRGLLDKIFYQVARSQSQEAFLSIILLTVLGMGTLTEGLGLSNTLGAFLAGVLLSETKYRYQVEADVSPFRGLLLGLFFMTVGFSIDLVFMWENLLLVGGMVSGLIFVKAAIITLLCLAFGMSLSSSQQAGLLLSQGGEFAFVAFGLAERYGILSKSLNKTLFTVVAITMAITPLVFDLSRKISKVIEEQAGFSHYVGQDSESMALKNSDNFVAVCGYGRVGKMVCDLLDKKFIPYIAFDSNPARAIEARQKGLPVFYGDVGRPEVLRSFNVGAAKIVVVTIADIRSTNRAVISLRREYPDLPIFVRAKDSKHKTRLQSTLDVKAMVPILPDDSILISLPFGGAILRSIGVSRDEVNSMIEEIRKKYIQDRGVDFDAEEVESLVRDFGLGMSSDEGVVETEWTESVETDSVDAESPSSS